MATTHQSFWTFWKPLRSIQVKVTRRQQPPTTRSNSQFTPASSKAASQSSVSPSSLSLNETVPAAGMSFKRFTRFTTDAGGLEKILRLLQSIAQILAFLAVKVDDVVYWMYLRKQFALGRRYFRFFKFLVCFEKAYAAFSSPLEMTFQKMLEVGKWTCMGFYLGLESSTILDAIGIHRTPLAEKLMIEANRFWFYSLVCSILLRVMALYERKREIIRISEKRIIVKMSSGGRGKGGLGLKRRLLSDCADLLIPGHVVGWVVTNQGVVGAASVISTVLSAKDIWDNL